MVTLARSPGGASVAISKTIVKLVWSIRKITILLQVFKIFLKLQTDGFW